MDFLLDPAWIAVFGTLAGGLFLKAIENFNSKAKELEPAQAEPVKEVETSRWVCDKYEVHTFEQKLADNGVIKQDEVTLCDNTSCELCKPERERRREARRESMPVKVGEAGTEADLKRFNELQRTDPRYKGYRFKDYMFQKKMKENGQAERQRLARRGEGGCAYCGIWLPSITEDVCMNCNVVMRREENPIVLPSRGMEIEIVRPPQVPEYAYPTDIEAGDGFHMRMWSWIDPVSGKQMGLRQVITQNIEAAISLPERKPLRPDVPEFDRVG